jgi:hypothetical protein
MFVMLITLGAISHGCWICNIHRNLHVNCVCTLLLILTPAVYYYVNCAVATGLTKEVPLHSTANSA